MSDSEDRIVAIKAVIDLVQPDVAPTLTTGEVELAVDRARLVNTWTANTAYSIGAHMVPPIRNGHCYECVQPGTSQSAARGYNDFPRIEGQCFSDGSSDPALIWEESGSDLFNPGIQGAERNVYDINKAARECWLMKARKASEIVDIQDSALSQIRKHCTQEAEGFRPYRRAITLVRC